MSILRKDPLPPMAIAISSFSSKSSGLFSSFGKDVVLLLTFAVYCLVKGYQLGDFKRINQQLGAQPDFLSRGSIKLQIQKFLKKCVNSGLFLCFLIGSYERKYYRKNWTLRGGLELGVFELGNKLSEAFSYPQIAQMKIRNLLPAAVIRLHVGDQRSIL